MNIDTFLQQMKIKAEAKAAEMKQLEASIWDAKHESELKAHFGFSDKQILERKKQILTNA